MSTEMATRPAATSPAHPATPATPPADTTAPPAGQAVARPTGGQGVARNLSVFSVLDMIGQEMAALNADLALLGEALVPLDKTAEAIDMVVTNVDERSQLYEAPLATREATDAASAVASQMADMSVAVRQHTYTTQELNAAAFVALQTMRDVQDSQRAMGAGSRLLRDAGR
jgi:hypothetical protein